MLLTDIEFEKIMKVKKLFIDKKIELTHKNCYNIYNIISQDKKNKFILDVDRRNRIELKKMKLQNRCTNINELLIRVEIDSPPHTNPDSTITSRNHIHIYKEGYGLKWAYNLENFDNKYFKNINDFLNVFTDFCLFCNIDINNINNLQGVI